MSADVRGNYGPFLGCPRLVRAIAFRDLFDLWILSAGVGNRFNEHYSCPRLSAGCGKIKHALVRGVFPCLLVLGET